MVAGATRPGVPVPANMLSNRPLAARAGLYQSCVALRERLWCVRGFGETFLEPVSPGMQPQYDPVTQLWQCFRLGTPLCVLFNALMPGRMRPLSLSVEGNLSSANACKALVMRFLIALKEQLGWDTDDTFTVTQLYVNDTNGFVRVVRTVDRLLDVLATQGRLLPQPERAFRADGPARTGDERFRVITELLETERKYVHDLEVLQHYAGALAQHNILPSDTIHMLFCNLHQLVDVQRRFLICVEENALRAPEEQHFGHVFRSMEDDFSVYEPFCANYARALEIISRETQHLVQLKNMPGAAECYLEPSYELPAFLIKPVQRICKYPLLLEQLLKRTPTDAPRRDELVDALTVIRRITDKVNETSRIQGNLEVVRNLSTRVEDWKGHSLSSFGALLLHDIFLVSKGDSEREFHVYLFERILLCCKDTGPSQGQQQRSRPKGAALLRSRQGSFSNSLPARRDTSTLQLKGRIFISNIVRIQAFARSGTPDTMIGSYTLQVWWRGETENESFCIKCRNDETLRMWHTTLQRLLDEYALRRQIAINARAKLPKLNLNATRTPTAATFMQVATPVVPTPLDIPTLHGQSDEASDRRSADAELTYRRPSAVSASAIAGARGRAMQRPAVPVRSMSAAVSGTTTPTAPDAELNAMSLNNTFRPSPGRMATVAMQPTLSDSAALREMPVLPQIPPMQPMSPVLATQSSPTLSGWNPYFPAINQPVSQAPSPHGTVQEQATRLGSSYSALPSPVAARVRRGDVVFDCAIPGATTFAALVEMIHNQFELRGVAFEPTNVSPHAASFGAQLYYVDDDGDRVMMYDNEDLTVAMDMARSAGSHLQLIVP